jgi:phage terminase small subunit
MPVLANTKHEPFAHAIAKGLPQREAYKAAGYSAKNDATADACASRLLSGANIQSRVAELRQAISTHIVEKTSVSKAWVIAKLVP